MFVGQAIAHAAWGKRFGREIGGSGADLGGYDYVWIAGQRACMTVNVLNWDPESVTLNL